ncbi:hypothetical protein QTN24_24430 [Cupriavidus sp. SZY C1]|uniref:hypothetical protein n=1 Tax=Cupriavidus sp. SZY C1 TaxID=3055037 RepID=UPI0028B4CC5D|nr:hypothetical protein [Cupriavidus sp. SZY C1]MDT6964669.1 hypothetical protein [Cupriavidus sp. SZY C1]
MRRIRAGWWLAALLGLPALPPLRGLFESSMALLMLALLPGLFAAGCLLPRVLAARWAPRRRARALVRLRPHALALLVAASAGYGVWMLPIAIDLSRMAWLLGVARDVSVCAAGLAAALAVRLALWPLVLFFGGNLVWMGLTFGILFVDAPARLCASYLLDDQRVAGAGLIALSLGLGGWLLAWAARQADAAPSAGMRKKLKKAGRLPIKAANEKCHHKTGPDQSPA